MLCKENDVPYEWVNNMENFDKIILCEFWILQLYTIYSILFLNDKYKARQLFNQKFILSSLINYVW